MLEPFAPYRRLRNLLAFVKVQDANALSYLSGQYYADLATWFLLAWSGESLRRDGHAVPELMGKGDAFTLADRERLLAELSSVLQQLIPRYRALGERGQVELSCTPANHPLAPLLIDFNAAREAWPESPLPSAPEYPGGRTRVDAQLAAALASHERRFGTAPAGLWPAAANCWPMLERRVLRQGPPRRMAPCSRAQLRARQGRRVGGAADSTAGVATDGRREAAIRYAMASERLRDFGIMENMTDLPDVSSCHVERRQPPATVHGVVFDILAICPCDGVREP